jgi:hypothetical protein
MKGKGLPEYAYCAEQILPFRTPETGTVEKPAGLFRYWITSPAQEGQISNSAFG